MNKVNLTGFYRIRILSNKNNPPACASELPSPQRRRAGDEVKYCMFLIWSPAFISSPSKPLAKRFPGNWLWSNMEL
jgi:hypothetical protein